VGVDVPFRCACGALQGRLLGISAKSGNHLVCYCDDCQAFAHFLGGADRILDAHGGTEIFQMSPARIEITQGADRLACMSLRGRLFRWYTSCCRTPIGNTLPTHRLPFVGLVVAGIANANGGSSRDDVLGPIRARIFGRFARSRSGDRSKLDAHDGTPLGMVLGFMLVLLAARLRGDHRRSPFFDAATGAPVATPYVLSPEELRAVEQARDGA